MLNSRDSQTDRRASTHRRRLRARVAALVALSAVFHPQAARASGLGLDAFESAENLLSGSELKTIIQTLGTFGANRPYEPATPLGMTIGFDAGVTITVVKMPDDFRKLVGSSALPIVPVPTLQVHKGVGDRVDIGAFWMSYRGEGMYGGDLKLAVWVPEEGPTWAMRLGYSSVNASFFHCDVFSPQILASRRLDFADPYIGVGANLIYGKMEIDFSKFSPLLDYKLVEKSNAQQFFGFLGLALKIPRVGLKLTLEGSYNTFGAHTMGTKMGVNF